MSDAEVMLAELLKMSFQATSATLSAQRRNHDGAPGRQETIGYLEKAATFFEAAARRARSAKALIERRVAIESETTKAN